MNPLQFEVHPENPFAKYLLKRCNVGIVQDGDLFSFTSPKPIFPNLTSGD